MQEANTFNKSEPNGIDIRRIFFLILKYWYWVLLSVTIALLVAYSVNRYTVRIFPVTMTILIKDQNEQDNAISGLIYNSRGFMPGKNYYNEVILLSSYPLIRNTIANLDFGVSYFQEGDIKTSELYPGPPIEILTDSTRSAMVYGKNFYFQVKDENSFTIKSANVGNFSITANFDQWFEFEGADYKIKKQNGQKISSFRDELLVVFRSEASVAASYTGRIKVRWLQEGASILSLTLNGPTPPKEAAFLMKLAETYQKRDLMLKNEQATRTVDFLDNQLAIISDSLVNLEVEIQKFKETNFVAGLSNEANRFQEKLDRLYEQQSKLILEDNYYNYLANYLQSKDNQKEVTIPASAGVSNVLLNDLVRQLLEIQIERKQLSQNVREGNPFITQMNNKMSEIEAGIMELLSSLKGSLEVTKAGLNNQINVLQDDLSSLPNVEREYVNLNRLYTLSESLFLILMEKRAEASITKASNTSDVVIVNPPKVGGAITPKTNRNYMLALFLGLGLPIGLILLFDYFNDKVKFKEDIEKHTSIPFLGVIGHNKNKTNLVVHKAPRSAITESFRSIRSNIEFFIENKTSKTILITSSIAGEGKTFCGDNLAMIFASTGRRTVLIGADMRRPKLFRDFDLSNEFGLSNYLSSDLEIDAIIQESPFDNLFIINSGTIPPNPSELLLREKLTRLMHELKDNFDFIIIDSPPIGLVTDAMILSKYVDHSIYIIRQGYTPVGTVKSVDEMYRAGKMKDLSILFNDVTVNKYGYGYGYSYKYGYTYGYGYSNGSGYYPTENRSGSFLNSLFKKR